MKLISTALERLERLDGAELLVLALVEDTLDRARRPAPPEAVSARPSSTAWSGSIPAYI